MTSNQQRAALHRQIWQIANEVRGAVDGWDFKQYVLGALFYRFISENFASYIKGGDDKTFDANPPYSVKWTRSDVPTLINDERFAPAGVLAPNLFFGSTIAVNILVLSKHKTGTAVARIDTLRAESDAIVTEIEGVEIEA